MSLVFAPGCALMISKPLLAGRLLDHLRRVHGVEAAHAVCCKHEPGLPPGTRVINVCPGCDRRYRELYAGVSTVSLWEILAGDDAFPFPDYGGAVMTILDACPTRTETRVHEAVRALLTRMNIRILEPRSTRTHGICCGDSLYGLVPVEEVKAAMRKGPARCRRMRSWSTASRASNPCTSAAGSPAIWSICCSANRLRPGHSIPMPGTLIFRNTSTGIEPWPADSLMIPFALS